MPCRWRAAPCTRACTSPACNGRGTSSTWCPWARPTTARHWNAPANGCTQLDRHAATRPFTRLAGLRSAGITDLRHGYLLDTDWQASGDTLRDPDAQQPLPLPEGVACYAVAATVAGRRHAWAERVIGDGLVPLPSALGRHRLPGRSLVFASDAQWIAYRTNHLQLLSNPEVARQIVRWLAPPGAGTAEDGA